MRTVYVLLIGVTVWGTILIQVGDGLEDGWRKNLFGLLMVVIFFFGLLLIKECINFLKNFVIENN